MAERTMTVCDVEDDVGLAVLSAARVRLSLDGDVREVDLCPAHLEQLRDAVASVLPAAPVRTRRGGSGTARRVPAQPAGGRRGRPRRPTAPAAGDGLAALAYSDEVRRWARESGLAVKDRGRIAAAVLDRYRARTEDPPPTLSQSPAE
jgi:hypothetical protein